MIRRGLKEHGDAGALTARVKRGHGFATQAMTLRKEDMLTTIPYRMVVF